MLKGKILEVIGRRNEEVGVVVKDLDSKDWLIKFNENKVFPSASTIKIPIMLEALRQVELGKLSLNQSVNIKEEDKVGFSIISELGVKEYSLLDLITLMMIISDNTATNLLIDLLGYENINNFLEELDLENTKLQRKMMDFQAIKDGYKNTTSPMEMGIIIDNMASNKILNKENTKIALDIMKGQLHKDCIPRYLPEDTTIGHKTGDLKGLNHDIGIVYLKNRKYIIGVFTEGAKENLENKRLIGKISKLVYDFLI